MKNKDRVGNQLKDLTTALDGDQALGVTAQTIAEALGLQRNVVSHLLNELVAEEQVVKINTRPVYFLDRGVYGEGRERFRKANRHLLVSASPEPETKDEQEASGESQSDVFEQLIGYEGSLRDIVEQCKSAVHYPPSGLPILLVGNSGVGKSFLAQLVSDYGRQAGAVGSEAPFILFNCAEYANNSELLSAALFGYCKGAFTGADKDKVGLIEEADGGFLFLDEIHRLSPEGQEKLFIFLDKGIFRRVGESGKWRRANVRMIYATTENPESSFLQTFLRRIPLVVKIPTFQERPLKEKLDLIQTLYHRESKCIDKEIVVSNQVVHLLMKSKANGNIGKLTNAVKISCASAFNANSQERSCRQLNIKIRHLPKEYLEQFDGVIFDNIGFEDMRLSPLERAPRKSGSAALVRRTGYTKAMLHHYRHLKQQDIDMDGFLNRAYAVINELIDDLIFKESTRKSNSVIFNSIEKVVENALTLAQVNYGIKHYGNSVEVITYLLAHFMEHHPSGQNEQDEMGAMMEHLTLTLSKEWKLTSRIIDLVENNLDVTIDRMAGPYLMMYIKSFNRDMSNEQANAVIVAHGYTTASSIASVANRMLGKYVFEAFDMPLEVSAAEIGSRLNAYVETIDTAKGLVILVDMGSLEGLYKAIDKDFYGDIAIINNISTQLALDVGSRIIGQQPIELIARETVENNGYRYNFRPSEKVRMNAIVTTCSTGIGTASKIKDLLERCFSNEEIRIIAHDYDKLKGNGKGDYIFKQYDVKLIIGTNNPQIPDVPYVSLENLIMQRNEGVMTTALGAIVRDKTLDQFNREIIKLFTLENVLNYLTILNPDKIIDQVEKALSHLEIGMGFKLQNDHKISLTIHICCMIERLVIKDPIAGYARFDDFEQCHQHFVRLVKNAFSVIEKFYKVEIPLSEIGFIYENIQFRVDDFEM